MEGEKQPEKSSAQKAEEGVQDAVNAAKDGASFAKNAASGNYLGAAKDAANLLQNKKARMHIMISSIMQIAMPIFIILFIAGLFMSVIQGIGNAIGDGISAVGGWFSGDSIDTSGNRYSITVNNDTFEGIVSAMASQGINAESSSLTEECLKLFIIAQYRTQYPDDVEIRIEVSDEEKQKIEARANTFGRGTNLVNEDGKNYLKTTGCIQLYRPEFTSSKLRYVDQTVLDEYVNGTNENYDTFDEVKEYYSLDENNNLVLPQKRTIKNLIGEEEREDSIIDLTQDNDGIDWESFNNNTTPDRETEEHSIVTLPYQTTISNYSMPVEFLAILTSFTQNSEYGVAVANLVTNDSSMTLNILDNSKTTEIRKIRQYESHTNVKYMIGAKAYLPIYSALWISYNGNIRDYYVNDRERVWKANTSVYSATETPSPYVYDTRTPYRQLSNTITTQYTTTIQVGSVNSWVVEQTNTVNVDELPAELDDSIEDNPSVVTNNQVQQRFNLSIEPRVYDSLQELYDNNESFRNFFENYYKKDTGEWWLSDFRDDLFAVNGVDTNTIIPYLKTYVRDKLWRKLYEEELGGSGSGLDYNAIMERVYSSLDSGNLTVEKYNHVVDANRDYYRELDEDVNYNIDSNSYDVMPKEIANSIENQQWKTAYYVSEKQYSTTNGEAEENLDAFINLLITGTGDNREYVEYTIDNGTRKKPGSDLASAPDMLFEILGGNPKTANLEDVMRYVMYKITGRDYGVTDFETALRSMTRRVGANYNITDESIFITNRNDLIEAIESLGLSAQAQQNLIDNAEAFLDMQSRYRVNATFAISIAIAESSAGTNWEAIDPQTYNWMSITGTYNGQAIGNWRKYPSFREATLDFGDLISGSTYCGGGNNTISAIGNIYCPNTEEFPNQADTWISNVQSTMTRLLRAADVDLSAYDVGIGGTVVEKAIECHKYLRENGYTYGGGYSIPDGIYNSGKIVDCSAYVSWVLYCAGYDSFAGHQETNFRTNHHGFATVPSNQIQPGDILVYPGHVEIAAQVENGKVVRVYNCGSNGSISSAGTAEYPETSGAIRWDYVVVLRAPEN